MIYFDDGESNTLYSIIESIYLEERFSDRLSNSSILVCPENIKYVIGKTVIINNTEYPMEYIPGLLDNGCTIISRIDLTDQDSRIKFHPYIIRPDFGIMWNGMTLEISGLTKASEITKELEDKIILDTSGRSYKLYFPKINKLPSDLLYDSKSNLTALGWLMHQVGINTCDSKFNNLDLLKTKKLLV